MAARCRRGLVAAVPVTLAALALVPAAGHAATTCVGLSGADCQATAPTIQAALDAAHDTPEPDRVVVGPGVFKGPFSYPGTGGGGIEVSGQGPATVLTAPPGTVATTVLSLAAGGPGEGSLVTSLTVRLPANANSTADTGIAAAAVANVRVASEAHEDQSAQPVGVSLSVPEGSLRNSVIELVGGGESGVGVMTQGGGPAPTVVSDSRITAPSGIVAWAQPTSVVRARIISGGTGVLACNSPVTVEDSLIRLFGAGIGLEAQGDEPCGTTQSALLARQVTIVGTGVDAGQVGAEASASVVGQSPSVEVVLSIVRQVETAFRAVSSAAAETTIRVGATDFEAGRHAEMPGPGSATFMQTGPDPDADPLFAGELAGDFTLRPGSPAIDFPISPPLAPGESATDLAGNPRVTDGDGDGVPARDLGAFEAPEVPDTTPPDTSIVIRRHKLRSRQRGTVVTIRFSSTEPGSSFECRLDAGRFVPCSSPFRRRLSFGRHRFEVRAVDAAGNVDPSPARGRVTVLRRRRKHRHRRHGHKRHGHKRHGHRIHRPV
jgi:hypothetical protein